MSKEKECPICHKVGFHKMSCPTQKMTVFISESGMSEFPTHHAIPTLEGDETAIFFPDENSEQKEIRKRLIDRAVELQNKYEEYMQKIREKLK